MNPTLPQLRRHALARSLPAPTTLLKAIHRLGGFVQADPIRAPARAQDLTLRQRVKNYRAGDLERRYPKLPIEEDYLVNYGFVSRDLHALMHPRVPRTVWPKKRCTQAEEVLAFVHERGVVHPREVDAHFAHGAVKNWFGGASKASTQLLDGMHYRGLLRVARRENGIRLYAAREVTPAPPDPHAAMDRLVDAVVAKYAPLPARSLGHLLSLLCGGVPHWRGARAVALARAKQRLPSAEAEGQRWYWPEGENPASRRHTVDDRVRLLAPFDPVVWDRHRFETFWGWAYRFEAYTPPARRVRGYYALPLLWHEQVIGWGNLSVQQGRLVPQLGYVVGRAPREAAYRSALDDELGAMSRFLGLD
jgi:uncharacterized protein YcaQ